MRAYILLLVLVLSGCEGYICGEARRNVVHYKNCIDVPYCALSAEEARHYRRYSAQLEHRCVGVEP